MVQINNSFGFNHKDAPYHQIFQPAAAYKSLLPSPPTSPLHLQKQILTEALAVLFG